MELLLGERVNLRLSKSIFSGFSVLLGYDLYLKTKVHSLFLLLYRFYSISSLNFKVGRGELLAVVGHVGAGKSSLLSALLGTME